METLSKWGSSLSGEGMNYKTTLFILINSLSGTNDAVADYIPV